MGRGCFDEGVNTSDSSAQIVTAAREIAAPAARIFELIADPSRQPRWDGNENLSQASSGQRVHAVGDVFVMTLTSGNVRENQVVEFEEGRRIAWRPSEVGKPAPGHLWRWELEPIDAQRTRVTHTYAHLASLTLAAPEKHVNICRAPEAYGRHRLQRTSAGGSPVTSDSSQSTSRTPFTLRS